MGVLRELDTVAYIRFASVYRQFEDTSIPETPEEVATDADSDALLRSFAADVPEEVKIENSRILVEIEKG